MIIPLRFDDVKLFLYAQIFSPDVPRPKPLKLCLDTGAGSTTISLGLQASWKKGRLD